MASLNVEKNGFGYNSLRTTIRERKSTIVVLLRLVAIFATLSATIVMALNKETKTFTVATIGTTPVKANLTAKFQDTPANIFFVVANGLATLHNILVLVVEIFGNKFDPKGVRFTLVTILDIINVAILSAGSSSAAFMAEIAKHGNSHAQWNKICDKFDDFCNQGGGAILASFIGLAMLLLVTLVSNVGLCQTTESKDQDSVQL